MCGPTVQRSAIVKKTYYQMFQLSATGPNVCPTAFIYKVCVHLRHEVENTADHNIIFMSCKILSTQLLRLCTYNVPNSLSCSGVTHFSMLIICCRK